METKYLENKIINLEIINLNISKQQYINDFIKANQLIWNSMNIRNGKYSKPLTEQNFYVHTVHDFQIIQFLQHFEFQVINQFLCKTKKLFLEH